MQSQTIRQYYSSIPLNSFGCSLFNDVRVSDYIQMLNGREIYELKRIYKKACLEVLRKISKAFSWDCRYLGRDLNQGLTDSVNILFLCL
jgi:hypothetical protein